MESLTLATFQLLEIVWRCRLRCFVQALSPSGSVEMSARTRRQALLASGSSTSVTVPTFNGQVNCSSKVDQER